MDTWTLQAMGLSGSVNANEMANLADLKITARVW